jgi:hypothetical protein
MWYNKVVRDNDMNIIIQERIFFEECFNEEGDTFSVDVLGYSIFEWWEE